MVYYDIAPINTPSIFFSIESLSYSLLSLLLQSCHSHAIHDLTF